MNDDNKKHSGQFDASLKLPDDKPRDDSGDDSRQAAADLIRKRVEAAYTDEPDVKDEIKDIKETPISKRSRHQEFIYELTSTGKPLHEIQSAWHEYYAGLTDAEKHQVWQEFYDTHSRSSGHPAISRTSSRPHRRNKLAERLQSKTARSAAVRHPKKPRETRLPARKNTKKVNPLHSLIFGLAIGSVTILIFLFGFFNERIIAPFIQPSRNVSSIPIISSAPVGSEPKIIIPKINADVPVVYDVNTIEEAAIQKGLERGVVHYADTANPGQNGNVVIVGHSSGNIFNLGKYKFAFSLLRTLENGDTFFLHKDGKKYVYQVYKKSVVKPTEVSVLGLADKPATATLITCDPPGLNTNRLVVTAEQISPDPLTNAPSNTQNQLAQSTSLVPGNSPSLWSRLVNWFKS